MESDHHSSQRKSSKSRKRFSGLSSFPQYVNKVQSKMIELRRQSLANTAYNYHQDVGQPGLRAAAVSEALSAKQVSTRNSGGKKRKINVLSSCLDRQWSPGQQTNRNHRNATSPRKRSTALPRILTPLNHHSGSTRETLAVRSANREYKQPSAKTRQLQDVGSINSDATTQKIREDSPHPFATTWTNKLYPHRLPAPPSQCLAALPAPKSPLLTIPLQKPSGTSNYSLSTSSGSSTTSSNVSTPIPPSPSPISFLVASKSSLSSNEHSPPVRPRHTHLPPLSNGKLCVSNAAALPVQKTSSLPQLRSLTPARKTPTHSLGRSPARSPVCSSYIMPVTKLNPIVRPSQAGSFNSGRRSDHVRHHQVKNKTMNETAMFENSCTDMVSSSKECLSPIKSSTDCIQVQHTNEHQPPAALECGVAIVTDSEQIEFNNTLVNDELPSSGCESGKELMIPTITIRSATPIKTPNEDDSSLDRLCEQLVFDEHNTDS